MSIWQDANFVSCEGVTTWRTNCYFFCVCFEWPYRI